MVDLRRLIGRGRWAADFAVATAAGVFLGLLGPFGTFNGQPWQRVAYWTAMSWVGFAAFALVGRPLLARLSSRRGPAWAGLAGYVVAISAPLGLASWLAAAVIWPGARQLGHIPPDWYLESLTITVGYVALFAALGRYQREAAPAPRRPSPSLLGAPAGEVLCLQMEDHYVRVHTAEGSRLVLAIMGQAIAAVGRTPGLRVHRSWWVAEKAVTGVLVDGRNLRLTLVGGLSAGRPVERGGGSRGRLAGPRRHRGRRGRPGGPVAAMAEAALDAKGWNDLLADGRLPKFALICLGVWLNAADALVTATIMPSVGVDLGGYAYFSWSVAGFLVGAILAGASAGRLSELFGLRTATVLSGLLTAAGCVMSAAAPDIATFLLGRIVQGLGTGWISGFSMVAIALLFPVRHLARVFAAVSGVWGVATLLGPLVGGLYAAAHDWRGVFWLFAVQAGAFSAAAVWLLRDAALKRGGPGVPWLQLAVLGLGVAAIAAADVTRGAALSLGLVGAGLGVLALVLWIDARARVRLLPRGANRLTTVVGSGYACMFLLTAASMAFAIYGPPILQQLRGYSPLWAGYVIGVESLAWTVAALIVADASEWWDRFWTRAGAACVVASVLVLPWALADRPLAWVLVGGTLLGAGFGFSWSFMSRRLMAALSDDDRAIGTSAITAVRQTGAAAGAALAGAAANLVGFSGGLTDETARAASSAVFLIAIPLALAGTWAAFRLTGRTVR